MAPGGDRLSLFGSHHVHPDGRPTLETDCDVLFFSVLELDLLPIHRIAFCLDPKVVVAGYYSLEEEGTSRVFDPLNPARLMTALGLLVRQLQTILRNGQPRVRGGDRTADLGEACAYGGPSNGCVGGGGVLCDALVRCPFLKAAGHANRPEQERKNHNATVDSRAAPRPERWTVHGVASEGKSRPGSTGRQA